MGHCGGLLIKKNIYRTSTRRGYSVLPLHIFYCIPCGTCSVTVPLVYPLTNTFCTSSPTSSHAAMETSLTRKCRNFNKMSLPPVPHIFGFSFFMSTLSTTFQTCLKIKCDINQQYLKTVYPILSNLDNFHSLEVVDRVSETQL